MISNRDSKFIKSLQLKKYRIQENAFVVEGAKNIIELIQSDFQTEKIYLTEQFKEDYWGELEGCQVDFQLVTATQLSKVGTFKNNNAALAVVAIPERGNLNKIENIILAFDRLKDPGNMGTIMRIADWYGIKQIACSTDSVDCFNPKAITASMGSFTRVQVYFQDLAQLVSREANVYATTLSGQNMHETSFVSPAIILFGNESEGISEELLALADHQITIAGYGHAESLNVAVSTAVICDNLRRV